MKSTDDGTALADGSPLLSPELRAAIHKIDRDASTPPFAHMSRRPVSTIYELTKAIFGEGYLLSHQRRLALSAKPAASRSSENTHPVSSSDPKAGQS